MLKAYDVCSYLLYFMVSFALSFITSASEVMLQGFMKISWKRLISLAHGQTDGRMNTSKNITSLAEVMLLLVSIRLSMNKRYNNFQANFVKLCRIIYELLLWEELVEFRGWSYSEWPTHSHFGFCYDMLHMDLMQSNHPKNDCIL